MPTIKSPKLAPKLNDKSLQDVLQRMLDDIHGLASITAFETRTVDTKSGEKVTLSAPFEIAGAVPIKFITTLDSTTVVSKNNGNVEVVVEFGGAHQSITWLIFKKV